MIKILHLIKSLGRGGAEMLLPETLRVHDRERFAFAYGYFLPHKGQLAPMPTEQGAEVRCFAASTPGFAGDRWYKSGVRLPICTDPFR